MAERVAWTRRLQQIAKSGLLGIVGLLAIYCALGALYAIFVLVRLLGGELGLWEWELSFG